MLLTLEISTFIPKETFRDKRATLGTHFSDFEILFPKTSPVPKVPQVPIVPFGVKNANRKLPTLLG